MGATRNMTGTIALALALCAAAGAPDAHAEEGATLTALQLACQREANAQRHYAVYARAATREGLACTASIFLAVARAESVHETSHARELERLDGAALPKFTSVVVRSTAENLATAIATEKFERDELYRMFADFARRECLYEALASFDYARGAEATHMQLFADELARIGGPKPLERSVPALPAHLVPARPASGGPAWLAELLLTRQDPGPFAALDVEPQPVAFTNGPCSGPDPAIFVCPGCGSAFAERPKACRNCRTAGMKFTKFS